MQFIAIVFIFIISLKLECSVVFLIKKVCFPTHCCLVCYFYAEFDDPIGVGDVMS